jgi:hypothetical protein
MATSRKRSNSWQAHIQRNDYPDLSKSFNSRAEAVAWARKIESDLDSGINTQQINVNNTVLLRELLERYRNEVTIHKKHSSAMNSELLKNVK